MSEAVTSAGEPRMTPRVVATVAFAVGALHAVVAALLLMVIPWTTVGTFAVVLGATSLGVALPRLVERISGRKHDPFILAFYGTGLLKAGVVTIVVYLLLQ